MMYTREQRMKAIETFIANDYCREKTIRELGYPAAKTLSEWYRDYLREGRLHDDANGRSMYSVQEKIAALEHYYANGQKVARTCRALGYPSRSILTSWIMEGQKTQGLWHNKPEKTDKPKAKTMRAELISEKRLAEEKEALRIEKEKLEKQVILLNEEVKRLRQEHELLLAASDVIKKEMGIEITELTNREKAMVISALKERRDLSELLERLSMAKSSYYYQVKTMQHDKYAGIREKVIQIYQDNFCIYGYRRIYAKMKEDGIVVSEKVVRKIMNQEHLFVSYYKRKKFNSYLGEITPHAENIIRRDFRAKKPNEKWLTDITEFKIPAGKVYLSPMIDCYDGMPVTWTIGDSPNAELANRMLDQAIEKLPKGARPIVHSDRGSHYRWEGWLKRMREAGLTRSMSKKGCCADNSACEGFFGRLKNEMFYGRNWNGVSKEEFMEEVNAYIIWYSAERIKLTLGGMSPGAYRKAQGL